MLTVSRTPFWIGLTAGGALIAATTGVTYAQESQSSSSPRNASDSDSGSREGSASAQSSRQQHDEQLYRDSQSAQQQTQSNQRQQDRTEQTTQSWNRDEFRRAPEMRDRQSDDQTQSTARFDQGEEEGGLGVAIISDGGRWIRIARVYRETPAARMGLQPNDRITHVNGQPIQSTRDFIARIRSMNPGEQVELGIVRDQEERRLTGQLETREEALVMRDQQLQRQSREGWRTEFDRAEVYVDPNRAGDVMRRINAIERHLDSLRNELQNLRASLQQGRPNQFGRAWQQETAASYDETPSRSREIRTTSREQWESERRPQSFDNYQDRSYQDGRESGQTERFRDDIDADRFDDASGPGGEIGQERLRPQQGQSNQ
jgi:hypothetical protein